MDEKSNMVEVFTSSVRTFEVNEKSEFVWPYPSAPTELILKNAQAAGFNLLKPM